MVKVDRVTKSYGRTVACADISLTAEDGEITALVGPNGAGKSTFLSLLAGVLLPDRGTVSLNGHDTAADPVEARRQTGTVFENAPLYDSLTVAEHLRFTSGVYGLGGLQARSACERVLSESGLSEVANKPVRHLSRGFRQRTALAQALVHDPGILFLDEPTSGLDPLQIAEFRAILGRLSPGKTIFLSTHIMQEVETMCTRVVMLDRGTLIASGSIADILAQTGESTVERAFLSLSGRHRGESER